MVITAAVTLFLNGTELCWFAVGVWMCCCSGEQHCIIASSTEGEEAGEIYWPAYCTVLSSAPLHLAFNPLLRSSFSWSLVPYR